MAKKNRLGSDPLSWIGDSREEENAPVEPVKEKKASKPKKEKPKKEKPEPAPKADPPPVKEEIKEPPKPVEPPKPKVEEKPKPAPVKQEKPAPALAPVEEKPPVQEQRVVEQTPQAQTNQPLQQETLKAEGQYLAFMLSDEEYGIQIDKVQEIIGVQPITRVPQTKNYLKGVINLRGKIVSVMDMRLKFDMEEVEHTEETCIIVVQSLGSEKGVIVDKVSEVIDILKKDIEPVPAFDTSINTEYILGIGKPDGTVKILLDIDKVLQSNGAQA